MDIIIFLITLLITFLTARRVQNNFYILFYKISKNTRLSSYLTWILFLPGVFVHELSHYLLALLLGVRTGKFVLLPKISENRIILGHVEIGRSDFIRRFLVGIAPLCFGLFLIYLVVATVPTTGYQANAGALFLYGFLLFEIVNTMFLSKEDLKGSWKVFVPFCLLLTIYGYWLIQGDLGNIQTLYANGFASIQFRLGTLFLLPALIINILIIGITRILNRI